MENKTVRSHCEIPLETLFKPLSFNHF